MFYIWKRALVLTLLVTLFAATYSLEDDKSANVQSLSQVNKFENTTDYRLPDNVIPNEYYIRLTPFIIPDNFTFDGVVKIHATVTKGTSKIVLHVDEIVTHDLTVSSINQNNDAPTKLDVASVTRSEKYHFLNIIMKSPISAGTNISIEISYTGVLNTEMYGFFRNWYKINNETRWVLGTQFQPVAARRAFPCFDEPALKAIFYISIVVPTNYTALSNMPVKSVTKDNLIEFEKTPPMSTYIVAFTVTDYASLALDNPERTYKVWSNSELVHQLPHSLAVIPKSLDYLANQLAMPYPAAKLEMVAFPDFPPVAMENWGLLVYSEMCMLYDEGVTPLSLKRYIRNLVTHEIAHQWFGNLVTPRWWDYLWLSEAFAEYFEYHAYEDEISSWNLESQFVVNELHEAFVIDSIPDIHSVTHKVYSPDDITSIFDLISYNKGASLVRMLEKLLGSKIFFGALQRYLQANKYSTGTPELLFSAIEEEIKLNDYKLNATVAELMNSWTLQPGFPVIDAHFDGDTVTLKQKRFFLSPKSTSDEAKNINETIWVVPINWATRSNPNFNDTRTVTWLRKNSSSITIENATTDWIIFNVQQSGYYRVNYDEEMWGRIIRVLKSDKYETIHELNRASLMNDLFNLGRVGAVDYSIVLSASQYLSQETNYIPWKASISGLTYLKQRFMDYPEIYESFKFYVTSLLEPSFKRLGFNERSGEKDFDILLREAVLKWLCDSNHEECVNNSLKAFKTLQQNDSFSISPNLQSVVYCTAVRHGSTEDWNYLWNKFEKSNYAIEKLIILSSLACSKNLTNLERLLLTVITPMDGIRKQDMKDIFKSVAQASLDGTEVTLDFIDANYDKILESVADNSTMEYIFSTISQFMSTEKLLKKYAAFIEKNSQKVSIISDTLESSLKTANYEFDWHKKNAPHIFDWLKKISPSEVTHKK